MAYCDALKCRPSNETAAEVPADDGFAVWLGVADDDDAGAAVGFDVGVGLGLVVEVVDGVHANNTTRIRHGELPNTHSLLLLTDAPP